MPSRSDLSRGASPQGALPRGGSDPPGMQFLATSALSRHVLALRPIKREDDVPLPSSSAVNVLPCTSSWGKGPGLQIQSMQDMGSQTEQSSRRSEDKANQASLSSTDDGQYLCHAEMHGSLEAKDARTVTDLSSSIEDVGSAIASAFQAGIRDLRTEHNRDLQGSIEEVRSAIASEVHAGIRDLRIEYGHFFSQLSQQFEGVDGKPLSGSQATQKRWSQSLKPAHINDLALDIVTFENGGSKPSHIDESGDVVADCAAGVGQAEDAMAKQTSPTFDAMAALKDEDSEEDGAMESCAQVLKNRLQELEQDVSPNIGDNLQAAALEKAFNCALWWKSIEIPKRSGPLAQFVDSSAFGALTISVIIANSIFVAYIAQWEMEHTGEEHPPLHVHVERGFVGFYIVELGIKIAIHRLYFFLNNDMKWNILDFCLVSVSIVDVVLSIFFTAVSGGGDLTFMRIIRIMKMAKIIRAFRALRFFKDLLIILDSLRNSLLALFWCSIMLVFLLYIFAVMFLQAMADVLAFDAQTMDPQTMRAIEGSFGSMLLTMLSLYKSVTGGTDWGSLYDLISHAGEFYAFVYLFFVFFFTFALFNTLTGIFVEKAVSCSTPDREAMAMEKRRQVRQDAREFMHLCSMLDKGNTGYVTWTDFEREMHNEAMVAYMASVELEVHDVELFFHIVTGSSSHGKCRIDHFVDGCMQMKGPANSMDMQKQLFELDKLRKEVMASRKEIKTFLQQML